MDTQDIKASSEPYEPFIDPRQSPPEYAAAPLPPRGGAGGPAPAPRSRAPGPGPAPAQREGFTGNGPTLPKYYSGYSQDRKYYCDTYNICPIREGMESGPGPTTAPPTAPRPGPPSCSGPLIAPNYEYPMTQEALSQYNKALHTAVYQPQGSTPPTMPPPLPPATGEVAGYTDEDLDQFLKTQEMKSTPFHLPKVPKDDRPVPGRDPQSTPFAETLQNFTGPDGTPQLRPSKEGVLLDAEFQKGTAAASAHAPAPTDPWEKVWDMALFIVAGLLIILLLDQLFKLAMLYGMKRAFLAIEPLLERALATPGEP